ncbi:MAG: rhodanese-like domain-containing protein [Betaproteobacteria bacterium]|nr:rhodanese-like domain-containing protein [Betaproteobacteria bacterium]
MNKTAMRRLLLTPLLIFNTLIHAEVVEIDNAQLETLSKSGVPVIDIRLQSEWEETGIVPGSKLLTFFDEKGRSDAAAWLEKLKPIAKPNEPVIIICRSGNRTKPVSQFLTQQAGYTTVYNVKNGIKSWIGAGGQVTPAAPSIASCKTAKTC